jgi:tRNA (guanine10-N2)-dimethyltransferase
MTLSFFLLSGEHPTLPLAELRSVLYLYGVETPIEVLDQRVAVADVPSNIHQYICGRTAYTRVSGIVLSVQPHEGDGLPSLPLSKDLLETFVEHPTTFRTEVVEVGGASVDSMKMERLYADQLINLSARLRVSLERPKMVFLAIFTPHYVVAGIRLCQKPPRYFMGRKAAVRPFKIPSTLQPKLARCMVNLGVPNLDSRVYDPFAGAGAILIEASLMGHPAIGTELKTWIANGLLRNLSHYIGGHELLAQADARKPPFRRVFEAVVTDPPYGRSTTVPGKSLYKLLEDFFNSLLFILREDGRICITLPAEPHEVVGTLGLGLKIHCIERIYIHKDLTRFLAVLST